MSELPILLDDGDRTSILKNRLLKNYRHLRKWARRCSTDCFRIYDRDIKEYPFSIDIYAGRFCVHHFLFEGDEENKHKPVIEEALNALFGPSTIYWRTRFKRKKIEQYEKVDTLKQFFVVREYGLKFQVNLIDYLDTGLFLDHRETRQRVAARARGKRLLNLFAYTCAFSVHAAAQGAIYTKSVDMSNTYTEWGRTNFELNGLPEKHNPIVRADCLKFLQEERALYDVIVVDPPTLSRSKKMDEMFDVQQDHAALLFSALRLLANDGILFFSTNARRFTLDALGDYCVKEISDKTIPQDFHNKKIHRCWEITAPDRGHSGGALA